MTGTGEKKGALFFYLTAFSFPIPPTQYRDHVWQTPYESTSVSTYYLLCNGLHFSPTVPDDGQYISTYTYTVSKKSFPAFICML